MSYTYKYPRPQVSVDCVVFSFDNAALNVLLIKRGNEPFRNSWALPGGFVEMDENLKDAIKRELEEETGITDVEMRQLHTFGEPGRDPRGRVISIAFFTLIEMKSFEIRAASDAKEVKWFGMNSLPELAFDHEEILAMALRRLGNEMVDGT